MRKLYIITILLLASTYLFAQDFDVDEQYKQAMDNAKTAFEAKQFSAAVMFYREAQKIKPDKLLPKYKIEDIRTIYINSEMDSNKSPLAVSEPTKRVSKKRKEEIEIEKKTAEALFKKQATEKMYKEADQAKAELENLKISVSAVEIVEDDEVIDNVIINDIEPEREAEVDKVKQKESINIDYSKQKSPELTLTEIVIPKQEKPKPVVEVKKEAPNSKPKVEPQVKKENQIVSKPEPKPNFSLMTDSQKIEWIDKEQKLLAKTYPNKKTIENIEKPGKKITRVIMNINNKVTVYLKVIHSWGATFYFLDQTGQELKSINQQHFNLKTNLSTYGY